VSLYWKTLQVKATMQLHVQSPLVWAQAAANCAAYC